MSKLIEDAKAAGLLDIVDDENLVLDEFMECLAKFAALQIPDGYKIVPIEFNINVKALLFNRKYGSPSCQKRVVKLCICNGCITDRLEVMLLAMQPINTEVAR